MICNEVEPMVAIIAKWSRSDNLYVGVLGW